jgi:hypothetical protein
MYSLAKIQSAMEMAINGPNIEKILILEQGKESKNK